MLIYIHKNLNLCNDLCVSDIDKKILAIWISRDIGYRPPDGDNENLNGFLQNKMIEKSVSEKKIAT